MGGTTPTIDVKLDKKRDKELFLNFIRDGEVNERKIFQSYPKLSEAAHAIKVECDLEKTISIFIDSLYTQYQSQLKMIVEKEKAILDDAGEAIFSGLEKVMGCGWDSSVRFFAVPTFLPFSPFWKNRFYFSVYNEIIQGQPNKRRLDRIAIHELSHICWYQKLEKAYEKLDFELNKAANYYLKEAFAVVVCECEEFAKINNGFSPANKNLELLMVKANTEEIKFIDFFREWFKSRRKDGLNFDAILEAGLEIGRDIQEVLKEKMVIWEKYGSDFDKLREKGYQSPINLNQIEEK